MFLGKLHPVKALLTSQDVFTTLQLLLGGEVCWVTALDPTSPKEQAVQHLFFTCTPIVSMQEVSCFPRPTRNLYKTPPSGKSRAHYEKWDQKVVHLYVHIFCFPGDVSPVCRTAAMSHKARTPCLCVPGPLLLDVSLQTSATSSERQAHRSLEVTGKLNPDSLSADVLLT